MRPARCRFAPLLAGAMLAGVLGAAAPPAAARLIHLYALLAPPTGTGPGGGGSGLRHIALTLPPPARRAADLDVGSGPGGLFVATFNTLSHQLRYKLRYHRLAGRILAATIDGPAGQAHAHTLVRLRLRQNGRIEGVAHLGGRAEALVRKGRAEVVVTTAARPGGAIAGRIATGRPPRR